MTKLKKTDEVMQELWAIKDATTAQFATVGAYFSHLRELNRRKKVNAVQATRRTNSSDMSSPLLRRKAV